MIGIVERISRNEINRALIINRNAVTGMTMTSENSDYQRQHGSEFVKRELHRQENTRQSTAVAATLFSPRHFSLSARAIRVFSINHEKTIVWIDHFVLFDHVGDGGQSAGR